KREWILTHKENTRKKHKIINNAEPLQTLTFRVQITPAERKDYFISLKNAVLTINYPSHILPESETAQKVFRKAVENALRHEAKRILPPLLKDLAAQHGFKYDSVKISSSKGRWGSCSSRRNINLSYLLLTLPEHLVKYVLLHELCHTREMNHSAKFWQLLNSVTDNKAKALAAEIKR
ncbi:MAG: M48 family metallopeptidase, partial [Prevotellaceae bacterium]|nr:M48 family metallopeptidase [Prevotellaceae bacterium]